MMNVSLVKYFSNIRLLTEVALCIIFTYASLLKFHSFTSWLFKFANIPNLYTWHLGWIGYLIPVIEIGIALGLVIDKTKKYALICALFILTLYEIFLLYQLYSPYGNPCSCQGIFPFFDLEGHLALTSLLLLFALLSYLSFIASVKQDKSNLSNPV